MIIRSVSASFTLNLFCFQFSSLSSVYGADPNNIRGQFLMPVLLDTCSLKYTVVPGDLSLDIASDFGLTLEELLDRNRQISDPNKLYAGMVSEKRGAIMNRKLSI